MIEEGFSRNQIIDSVIAQYLIDPILANIDALILGSTHYPLIKDRIAEYYQNKIVILDPSDIVALAVKACLDLHNLLNKKAKLPNKFYVSDYTESFAASTQLFFTNNVELEHYPLWE